MTIYMIINEKQPQVLSKLQENMKLKTAPTAHSMESATNQKPIES